MRPALLALLLTLACKSPLTTLKSAEDGPALHLAPVKVEDHSRQLKRLRPMKPSEKNTPGARRITLETHGKWLEATFKSQAAACGIRSAPEAPYRLEFAVTGLGEVRTRYIVYGIASGVAWGVGTGLVAHNTQLAVGLGGYELIEESAFWIGGSNLFGSYFPPAVAEARLTRSDEGRPVWMEAYYALNGRSWTQALSKDLRSDRAIQLRASLQMIVLKILEDLEAIPGFPKGTRKRLVGSARDLEARILSGPTPAR